MNGRFGLAGAVLAVCLVLTGAAARGQAKEPAAQEKVILDTDIGDDIDDAYAVGLLASTPDAKLLGVTTTYGHTQERAQLAAKLLKVMGLPNVPVAAGRVGTGGIGRQYEWARGFKSKSIRTEPAVEFLRQEIEKSPGQVTLIGIGALTNVGDLIAKYPDTAHKLKRIVIMGGSVYNGYDVHGPPSVEWNIKCDPAAARAVYNSGIPLTMAGLEVTTMMQLDAERQKRIFGKGTLATDALAALTNLWGGGTPTLFDPVAVAFVLGHAFCDSEKQHVVVDDSGLTRITEGTPNVTVLVHPNKDAFLDWYVSVVR